MMATLFPGLPELASAHGGELDRLNGYIHWLMILMFIGWGLFFAFLLVRFRRKRNPRADYHGLRTHASQYAEIGVALAEAVLLIGFSIPLWSARVDALPPEDEALTVRVVAEQFAWNVHYPGADGLFGATRVELVDPQTNPVGLDPQDPVGRDDIVSLNQLHLPVGRPVVLHLSSKDVVHSFGLPEMRVKQDAIPGLVIPVWFTPTVTTAEMRERMGDEAYTYEIVCNQLCGIGHYRMKGYLTVETPEEFAAWLASQAAPAGDGGGGGDFWG
jgi:cytochrome c oxidase subunit 2